MTPAQRMPGTREKVLIVDDHPLLREGLGAVINRQDDLVVCGEACNAPAALAAVEKKRPDVVVVDISLEEGSGLDLIKSIHAVRPALPILVLSMHHEDLYAERALRAGAQGYVMKHESTAQVIAALRKVLQGRLAVSEDIVCRLLGRPSRRARSGSRLPSERLSDRELEIYRRLGEGCSTREIAAKLRISVSTVESYRASIKQKLNLRDAAKLVTHAAKFVAAHSGL